MPLQQLVEYYNDRFELEHRTRFRPLILNEGMVSGLFGPIQIGSQFTPVRSLTNPAQVGGHAAVCSVKPHDFQDIRRIDFEPLLNQESEQYTDFDNIINLDRLTRTVHLLNYLPIVHLGGMLFLEVDPRHILGIKRDHGAYFAEVIERCGLTTHNVVLSLTVNSVHARHHDRLLAGIYNYRNRGYRIALNLGVSHLNRTVMNLTARISPDYLRIHAPVQLQNLRLAAHNFTNLTELIETEDGQSIIKVDRKDQAIFSQLAAFDLIESENFDVLSELPLPEKAADSVYA